MESMIRKVELELAGRTLSLETGKVARQASGAVVARYGDTVVLATVVCAPSKREIDFFPLYVDYREMTYAAGKFPGGFFKREGRPSAKEVLTMRMIDRPIRPLFPDDYRDEVQIQCMVMSYDGQNDPDLVALIGSSAALALSPSPFGGPIGAVRIGRIDGQLVVNPTDPQLESSEMLLTAAGNSDGTNMIELGAREVSESVVAEAIALAQTQIQNILGLINKLTDGLAKEKTYTPAGPSAELIELVKGKIGEKLRAAKQIPGKTQRNDELSRIREELVAELCPAGESPAKYRTADVAEAFNTAEKKVQRAMILGGTRPDGRGRTEIRPITGEVAVLPRTHGSALFARGETMTMVAATLGTGSDEQSVDGLGEEYSKKFMLHYNFPPFSVGEIRPIRGPGRREIGHGALAEKSLEAVLPPVDVFPYTIRLVSEILESNGSSSMATVCGGSMALMDAGVPISRPVAGISVGRVTENGKEVLITDIIGEEDFHGDMDFKVSGTEKGITGIQLDLKARALPQSTIVTTLEQAREGRMFILGEMAKAISQSRPEISAYAPRLLTLKINPEKIGKLIGPGGKTVRSITEQTGVKIDIEDDGTVYIASVEAAAAEKARALVEAITEEVKIGRIYQGKVVSIKEFGAFVEIAPEQDGLCHISELSDTYVKNANEVCKIGDIIPVKVIAIDEQGRVKLSRKAALKEVVKGH
jgi:polyribonucleotide nucleotidyltransferase